MKLIIEHKEILRRSRLSIGRRLKYLDGIDVEKVSEHLIHRDKRSGHTPGGDKTYDFLVRFRAS